MITRNDILRSQFKTIEDYFDAVRDHVADGNKTEARQMLEKLSNKQLRECYHYLRTPVRYNSHIETMTMIIDLI